MKAMVYVLVKKMWRTFEFFRVSTWETEQNGWTETRKALQHFQELANNQSGECSDLPPNGKCLFSSMYCYVIISCTLLLNIASL